jgi:hypothetical protein
MKCGAGEEWRRSFGPIEWKMKKNNFQLWRRGAFDIE